MSAWKKVNTDDICKIIKGTTGIVRKVEILLAKVAEQENQIIERKQYTKLLLRGILKGEFEER